MLIPMCSDGAATGCSVEKTELNEVRLVEFLNRGLFLGQCGGECVQSDWSAGKFVDDCMQNIAIGGRETNRVDAEERQSFVNCFLVEITFVDLGKISTAFQKVVRSTRCEARAFGDFRASSRLELDAEYFCRAGDDLLDFFLCV